MRYYGVRRTFRALAFILIFAAMVTTFGTTAQAAEEEDKNIEVSAKDGSIKFTFSEEGLFFNKFTTNYVIQQGSEAISFDKNFKKGMLLKKQYGLKFKAVSSGNVRILLVLTRDDDTLEEALLYDLTIDDDKNVTYEQLKHFTPSYAARKGVAKNLKKLLVDDYGFSEDALGILQ